MEETPLCEAFFEGMVTQVKSMAEKAELLNVNNIEQDRRTVPLHVNGTVFLSNFTPEQKLI